jgi:hypothetical protein
MRIARRQRFDRDRIAGCRQMGTANRDALVNVLQRGPLKGAKSCNDPMSLVCDREKPRAIPQAQDERQFRLGECQL